MKAYIYKMRKTIKQILGYRVVKFLYHIQFIPLNIICSFFPAQDSIIFESHPDITDNTYACFQYALKQGLNKRYSLIWLVDDPRQYQSIDENVFYMELHPRGLNKKFQKYLLCNRSAAIIYCNRHFPAYCSNRKQVNIYLNHGSPLKSNRKSGYFTEIPCKFIATPSLFFVNYMMEEFDVSSHQIVCLGFPRNDWLYEKNKLLQRIYSDSENFEKVIIWAPTFRHYKDGMRIDCNSDFPFGIPLFNTEEEIREVCDLLRQKNYLLILKPHPAQDLSRIKGISLPNFRVLYDEEMRKNGVQTNQLLAQTDALIGDYSSIYYDYLLLDKPIAITLDDYELYKEQHGFVFDDPLEILKGVYLYTVKDLCLFLDSLSKPDTLLSERSKIKKLVNAYDDGNSAKRVYDFLIQELAKAQ